jgi:rubrerythrin
MQEMSDVQLGILDAIRAAKEAEQKAAQYYSEAVHKIDLPAAKQLFEQLAAFENYHFQKLDELEKSLIAEGKFVEYEGRELELPPLHEVKSLTVGNPGTLMEIITLAIDTEAEAEQAYRNLAEQTTDAEGKAMCLQLASEEEMHGRILKKAYWSLNDRGEWSW